MESCHLVDIKHICVIINDDDSLIFNFFVGDLVLCIYKKKFSNSCHGNRYKCYLQQIQMMNVSHSYYVLLYVMSHVAKVCRLVYGTSETICLRRR